MGRLKKLKFSGYEEMHEYYDENRKEFFTKTLDAIEKFWDKNKYMGNVDVYRVDVIGFPDVKYISVLEEEWGKMLDEVTGWAEENEEYDLAVKSRDITYKIFNIKPE